MTPGGSTFSGAAYLFRRSGTSWQQDTFFKASNAAEGDRFGHSVALSSDTVAIGCVQESSAATGINGDQTNPTESGVNSDAVYIFH